MDVSMSDDRKDEEIRRRRSAARRTAFGLIATVVLVYAMFIISGVVGQ